MALEGKTAVVTGAAMGIGKAMAEILLENGAKVALLDINEAAGKSLLESLKKKHGAKTLFVKCDVESEEQIKGVFTETRITNGKNLKRNVHIRWGERETSGGWKMYNRIINHFNSDSDFHTLVVKRLGDLIRLVLHTAFQKTTETFEGGIDILCNNAGILNETAWEKTVSINLTSVIRVTYVAMEMMNKLKGGQGGVIVNTASMAGIGPFPTCPTYTATKYGVVGFTRAIAGASAELGYGIRFNAICPGFVQTDLLTQIPGKLGQFCDLGESVHHMMEKMGVLTTADVAESLLELIKDETKNGDALLVLPNQRTYVEFPSFSP